MGRTGRCFSQQRTMRHMCGKALVRSSLLWLAAVACGGGCGRKPDGIPADAQPETSAQEATRRSAEAPVAITPPKAFEPPAIEALDRDAKWIDRPVRDGLQRLREEQAQEAAGVRHCTSEPPAPPAPPSHNHMPRSMSLYIPPTCSVTGGYCSAASACGV